MLVHFFPLIKATVASKSSISPWRQLWPSILDSDEMFPAPNAAAGVAKKSNAARHMSREVVCEGMLRGRREDEEEEEEEEEEDEV
jgi:hypothetical protein